MVWRMEEKQRGWLVRWLTSKLESPEQRSGSVPQHSLELQSCTDEALWEGQAAIRVRLFKCAEQAGIGIGTVVPADDGDCGGGAV